MSAIILDETSVARDELRNSQYGHFSNAAELIRGHWASMPPEVRSGVRLRRNEEATAEAKRAGAQKKIRVPDGGNLIDWCVRGQDERRQVISYIWEDERGIWHRGVQGYTADYEPPPESEQAEAARRVAVHEVTLSQEAAASASEVEKRLAEFRVELEAKQAERFAELQENLVAELKAVFGGEPGKSKASRSGARRASAGSAKSEPEGGESSQFEPDGEPKWPQQHKALDQLAKDADADLPADWGDRNVWTVEKKIELLQGQGVKPETEG